MYHGLQTHVIREIALSYPKRHESLKIISGQEDAAEFLKTLIGNAVKEHFVVLHLDTKNQLVSYSIATVGTVDASLIHPRETFGPALMANASSIIIGHNHPSGQLDASSQDHAVTRKLKEVGELLGIHLHDSLIVSQFGYRSIMH